MPTALITGPLEEAADTALALKAAGFEIVAAEPNTAHLPSTLREVDCYVQLPTDPPWGGDDAPPGARSVITHALLARFDAAAQVAPMLAAKARVVIVTEAADGTPALDRHVVRLLIEAVIADRGKEHVRVAVINGLRSPQELIAAAGSQPPAWTAYPRVEPQLSFCDWRNAIICQSSLDSWT